MLSPPQHCKYGVHTSVKWLLGLQATALHCLHFSSSTFPTLEQHSLSQRLPHAPLVRQRAPHLCESEVLLEHCEAGGAGQAEGGRPRDAVQLIARGGAPHLEPRAQSLQASAPPSTC